MSVVSIQAESDLVCLGQGLISPVWGLICHFKPKALDNVKDKTVAAVEGAVQSAKDLLLFDLTHNPIAVTYKFVETTKQGGLNQGLQSIANTGKDYEDVSIGFVKETINQANQLQGLIKTVSSEYWYDISICLIQGGSQLAYQAGLGKAKNFKRAGAIKEITKDDALRMANDCLTAGVQDLARPAIFNISSKPPSCMTKFSLTTIIEPDEQIGATISDIAALLIPIGGEEEAGVKAAQAVDLVIPGSEASTTVMKLPGVIGEAVSTREAEHFADDAEALQVRENMKDEEWAKANCHVCTPPAPSGVVSARNIKGRPWSRLVPRGNVLTSCCRVPEKKIPIVIEGYDESWEPESIQSKPGHDPKGYNYIVEDMLKDPPDYILRDPTQHTGRYGIQNDLNGLSTSVIPWAPDVLATMADPSGALTSSENLFQILRKVFAGPEDDPLYKALEISEREGKLRMVSRSKHWIDKSDPVLAPIQEFAHAAMEQGMNTVAALKKLSPEQMLDYDWETEFFYTAPSEEARTGTDPRGFHHDFGTLQFAASDTPGLVILNAATETASRVKIMPNTFHLMKALDWNIEALQAGSPRGPTFHSVFGPEMAQNGRVSMVMDIYNVNTVNLLREPLD